MSNKLRGIYNQIWSRLFYNEWLRERVVGFLKKIPWYIRYPDCIEIEVSTFCNLKCIMCEHTYWKEPPKNMSFKQLKSIVDQFPKLKWMGLTGIGESFMNKDFIKMLEYVKSKGIFVELYDPFILITPERSRKLVELGIDRMYVSLDAATKKTYEKIRVGANFDNVVKNLKAIIKAKKKHGKKKPVLDFHFIASKYNNNEIPEYLELVASLDTGCREVLITRVLHNFKEVNNMFEEIPKEIIDKANKIAKEKKIPLKWGADVPEKLPPMKECMAWMMPFIFVTGHVIPCCATNEANKREFQKRYALGNVFEKPFMEIWNGKKYKKLRKMLRKGKCPTICSYCTIYEAPKSG